MWFKKYFASFLLILSFQIISTNLNAQHTPSNERGDPNYRAKIQLESNRIRTTIHNFGFTGRTGGEFSIDEQTPYEWPKYSNKVYLTLTALFIGAEVIDSSGDTIHIVDVPIFRNSPNGSTWNFEPVPDYYNKSVEIVTVASSTDNNSWPEFWPDRVNDSNDPGWMGSWDGYLGKNKFFNGQEVYYKISDDKYTRYDNYKPDTTDLTRGGLGVLISCREIEMNDTPFEDVVFHIYTIKNDGTKKLNKVTLTKWFADFVGGNGDSQDDIFNYDLANNLVWSKDKDGNAPDFGSDPVGMIGLAFLRTPIGSTLNKRLGISSISHDPAGSWDFNNVSDEVIWNKLMTPGRFIDPNSFTTGEYDGFISSGYFSLLPGESEEFILSTIMANGNSDNDKLDDLYHKLNSSRLLVENEFNFNKFDVSIQNPIPLNTYSGSDNIEWTTTNNVGNTTALIYHSSDYGDSWKLLNSDSANIGFYNWNTDVIEEGILNLLQVYNIANNGVGIGFTDSIFTINRLGTNIPPQIYITSPIDGQEISGTFEIKFISGDADEDSSKTNIYYRYYDWMGWKLINEPFTASSLYWNTENLPNSENYQLMGEVISLSDTGRFISDYFSVNNFRHEIDDSTFSYFSKSVGTGSIEINVIDTNLVTDHTYFVEFDSISLLNKLGYNVYDDFNKMKLVDNAFNVDGDVEGPMFHGIRLVIKNDSLEINKKLTGWDKEDIMKSVFERLQTSSEIGIEKLSDYLLIFGETGIDTSIGGYLSGNYFPSKEVNFTVYNVTENEKIDFVFIELDDTGGEGKFTADGSRKDRIIFKEKFGQNDSSYTYWVYLDGDQNIGLRFPETGDSLKIKQYKPFVEDDKIYFSSSNLVVSTKNEQNNLQDFYLYQNYPNPFNPITTIKFQIPHSEHISVKIYDVLGSEIQMLLDEFKSAGTYKVQFDASSFSSGVYFVRIKAGIFSETRKLMLVK